MAGVPFNSPDSLFVSIIHQFILNHPTFEYNISPDNLLNQFKIHLNSFLTTHQNATQGLNQLLQSISCFLNIKINVFHQNEFFSYQPDTVLLPTWTANIYLNIKSFDSVISINPAKFINDPQISPNQFVRYNLATWNLNGATSTEKRLLIDHELKTHNISLACIQESHLWCSLVTSPNYYWLLGPQSLGRASRGLGFLISKSLYPTVLTHKFITPNIGYISLKPPFMTQPLHIINVHKCNEGAPNSAIETGIS